MEFLATTEEEAKKKVFQREAQFAIVTVDTTDDFEVKTLEECTFLVVASKCHPLVKNQGSGKNYEIEEILKHPFISPSSSFLGQVGTKQSLDGWRDDKFQRNIKFKSSSLKLIEEFVSNGVALAYLPYHAAGSFVKAGEWVIIKISDCPYVCKQKIKLITRNPIETSWIQQVF